MARMFCVPGVFFLFGAFVLLLVTSINLPFLTALDFVRTHFDVGSSNGTSGSIANTSDIDQIRVSLSISLWVEYVLT